MCIDPISATFAAISIGASVASGVSQAQQQSAQFAADQAAANEAQQQVNQDAARARATAEENAIIAEREAALQRQLTSRDQALTISEFADIRGRQRGQIVASGLSLGSASALQLGDRAVIAEALALDDLRINGAQRASGLDREAVLQRRGGDRLRTPIIQQPRPVNNDIPLIGALARGAGTLLTNRTTLFPGLAVRRA
jgi:hypothetical protein